MVQPMIGLIRYWPHALIAVCLLAIAGVIGHAVWTWGYDTANVRAEKVIGEFAKAEAVAQEKARAVEQRRAEDLAALDAKYQRELDDAKGKAESVAADLRAGNLRLRQHWQASIATCELSADTTAALHAEQQAQLRAESAARIVRLGAEADAQIRALQEAYEALRRPAP